MISSLNLVFVYERKMQELLQLPLGPVRRHGGHAALPQTPI